MSTTFDRVRMAAAVAVCAGLLALSGRAERGGGRFLPPAVTAEQKAAVRIAAAVLRGGKSPLTGIEACDGVKSLIPDQISAEDGARKLASAGSRDVIVCYRDDIDYGDALAAMMTRKLFWQSGLGGDRIVVFAPSQARFMTVANENHIVVRPSDLHPFSLFMNRLVANPRSRQQDDAWIIQSGPESEALFGPYLDLPAGDYRVRLTFTPSEPGACRTMGDLHASMAVATDARKHVLTAKQPVALKARDGTGCQVSGAIDFTAPAGGAKGIETPLWIASRSAVKLTGYDIETR
jgi:hypothetical protein